MKLKDDKTTYRPYNRKFKDHKLECIDNMGNGSKYLFSGTITGDTENISVMLTSGYPDFGDEYTNNFIISIDDLFKLKDMIISIEEEYNDYLTCICNINDCYTELHNYIKYGIVDHIVLEKLDGSYPNYHEELYTIFKITPKFIPDLSSKDIDITVNIGFNFIDCFHIIPTDKSIGEFLRKIVGEDGGDINIKFINYDISKEAEKYKQRMLKELDEYNSHKRRIPTAEERKEMEKMLHDMRKKTNNNPV